MSQRRSNTVLGLSIAAFAAAVIGVQLGESAIGAIHPAYFAGEPLAPRAVDPRERQPGQPAYYQAYDWAQGEAAREIACGDNCGRPEAYDPYALVEPAPRLIRAAWSDEPVPEPEPWPPGQISDAPRAAVARFADFPIEEKPAPSDEEQDGPGVDLYDEE